MQGKIVKGIAGFYYVHVVGFGIYECKAKGSFRKEKRKPLVGDNVEIDCLSEEEKTGNIIQIFQGKTIDPSGSSKYRSSTCCLCSDGSKATLQSVRQIFDHDGDKRDSGGVMFQ